MGFDGAYEIPRLTRPARKIKKNATCAPALYLINIIHYPSFASLLSTNPLNSFYLSLVTQSSNTPSPITYPFIFHPSFLHLPSSYPLLTYFLTYLVALAPTLI